MRRSCYIEAAVAGFTVGLVYLRIWYPRPARAVPAGSAQGVAEFGVRLERCIAQSLSQQTRLYILDAFSRYSRPRIDSLLLSPEIKTRLVRAASHAKRRLGKRVAWAGVD